MSWLYLPERVADCSPQNGCSDGGPSVTSRTPVTRSQSSRRESGTAASMTRQFGPMCEHSTGDLGVDAWILSLRDSPASRSVAPARGWRSAMNATSGRIPFALLERSLLNGCYWKMSQGCWLTLIPDEFSQTWPRAGMMRDGIAYRRRPWAPITRGTASGLLPTPVAGPFGSNTTMRRRGETVRSRIMNWPTPTVSDSANRRNSTARQGGDTLVDAVTKWPTPTKADSRNTRNSTAKRNRIPPSGIHAGDTLVDAVTKWPTPTVRDSRNRGPSEAQRNSPALNHVATGGVGGKLNPMWVEWIMGWPLGWTDLRRLGRDRFRRWLRLHGGCWVEED